MEKVVMEKIEFILQQVKVLTLKYRAELQQFEITLKTEPLSSYHHSTKEEQIKHQTQAFNLFNQHIDNLISRIDLIQNMVNGDKKMKHLKSFGSNNSLTNGKFYDYAVGHEMWREKEPSLFDLIDTKLKEYIDLEHNLNIVVAKIAK
jgi:hypothetical protein